MDWNAALQMMPLAIVGSLVGQWIFNKLPAADLKRVFGGFMLLVGIRMLFGK